MYKIINNISIVISDKIIIYTLIFILNKMTDQI
jgi:hypothetical protein